MTRLVHVALVAGVLLSGAARAQSPEDEWGGLPAPAPNTTPGPAPLPPAPAPLPPPPPSPVGPTLMTPAPLRPRAEVLARVRPPQDRNDISMSGGNSLGSLRRGEMVLLGFPLLQLRAMIGLGDRFDLGLGFDSYYFLMNEPRLVSRLSILKGDAFALSVNLEAGYAFFAQRAPRESRGARWLTGHRNINIAPAIVGSYQGSSPRAARLFLELRYLLAFDTEPFSTDPLVGVPPSIIIGHNVMLKGGAELPLSAKTSFVLTFGLDVHSRANDAPVMPMAALGLVTSL